MNRVNYQHIQKKFIRSVFVALVAMTYSCDEKLTEELTAVNFERGFSTTSVTTQPGQTSVLIQWVNPPYTSGDDTFTIEVATDETFANGAEKSFQSSVNRIVLTDTDIAVRRDYYARVKVNAKAGREESLWQYSEKFRLTGDQYLNIIKYDEIYSDEVTVRWDATKQVTHLTINGDRVDLSESDKAAGLKVITGLAPATAYELIIFDNNADKGVRTFTTKLGIPNGTIKQLSVGDDIKAAIEGAANGDVFVLPQGSTFIASASIAIPNGVSITVFGEEGPNKPTIRTAGTGFSLPAASGDITFRNINFDGTFSQYIINQSNAATVETLTFENCSMLGYANTPIRLQNASSAKTIGKLVLNYCTVGNIAPSQNYAVIHASHDNCKINNIEVTNSTFYNIGIGLIVHTNADAASLLVDNCTFYDITRGDNNSRYLISYGTKKLATATITNSIFSMTKNSNAGGILIADSYTSTNNYQTADYIVARDGIKGAANYAQASTELFENPSAADFTIKDGAFAGKLSAGDPRWRIE